AAPRHGGRPAGIGHRAIALQPGRSPVLRRGRKPMTIATTHHPIAFTSVEFTDRLWAPRQQVVRERTVPFLYGQMVKIGTIEALDVTKPPGPLAFPYRKNNTSTSVMYWDSDIAKWIETASYTLATHPDAALDALIDD